MKNLLTLLLILFSATLAIAQPPNQNLSAVDPQLNNGFTMAAMKLTGKEFKGKAPEGSYGTSLTKTFIGLQKLQAIQITGAKSKYLFSIIPYFSFNSWITDSVKNDPVILAKILGHEQNHYDIHLLMARELLKQLSETYFISTNYAGAILAIRDKLTHQEFNINQLYELETNHGQNEEAQKKWNDLVSTAMQKKDWETLVGAVK